MGFDKNPYLIDLLIAVKNDQEFPDTISEEEYYNVRDNKDKYPSWYVGLVGFCASYGGRFFEGYPRGLKNDGTPRDYTNEAMRNLKKQSNDLKGIEFYHADYITLNFTKIKALIYCDSPYRNCKPYKTYLLGKFDSDKYFDWVRIQSEYNPILISEYEAPNDFICIWEKKVKSNMNWNNTKESVEKVFIYNKWL